MKALRLLVVAALVPLACSEPATSPPAGLRVETSAARFAPNQEVTYTVVNGSAETVRLYRCCDFVTALDKVKGRGWQEVRAGGEVVCLAICAMGPYPVPPMTGVGGSTWVGDTGTFRLRLGRAVGNDIVWDVTSNSFEVR
jgi:hypothetical protein